MRKIYDKVSENSHLPNVAPKDVGGSVLMHTLHKALSVSRPDGSVEEAKFVAWMATTFHATLIDGAGNVHFDRRINGERSLFCCHSDSVAHRGGHNIIKHDGCFWRACGDVLGADDGAGIALMAHMLSQGVSGYFILFRGEEVGGLGSKWLVDNMPDLLIQFDRAIAFDRAGYYDVITHQAGVRCCSDEFADALAQQLSFEDSGLMFMPSDGGVYTDTAEFTALIPECTNLSIGYFQQHTTDEHQDVEFLRSLAEVLCLVNWEELPTSRDPAEKEDLWTGWAQYGITSKLGLSLVEEEEDIPATDVQELDLLLVLCQALQTGRYVDIGVQVQELLELESHPNTALLTQEIINSSVEALNNGFTAYDVAQDLREVMTNG